MDAEKRLQDIEDFVEIFLEKNNLQKSDLEIEGYWYIAKNGKDSINLKSFFIDGILGYTHSLTTQSQEPSKRDEWISVKDRLPEYYSNNLILDKEGKQYCAHRVSDSDESYYVITGTDNLIMEITHWKQLPKPPIK